MFHSTTGHHSLSVLLSEPLLRCLNSHGSAELHFSLFPPSFTKSFPGTVLRLTAPSHLSKSSPPRDVRPSINRPNPDLLVLLSEGGCSESVGVQWISGGAVNRWGWQWISGGAVNRWGCSESVGVQWIDGGAVNQWGCSESVGVQWIDGGAVNQWGCSESMGVQWISGGAVNRWGCSGACDVALHPESRSPTNRPLTQKAAENNSGLSLHQAPQAPQAQDPGSLLGHVNPEPRKQLWLVQLDVWIKPCAVTWLAFVMIISCLLLFTSLLSLHCRARPM